MTIMHPCPYCRRLRKVVAIVDGIRTKRIKVTHRCICRECGVYWDQAGPFVVGLRGLPGRH